MISSLSNVPIPRSLKVVAYLFVACGVLSVVGAIIEFFLGRFVFNLGVLYIMVGLGLLRLDPRWLVWAAVFTWLGLLLSCVAGVVAVLTPSHLQYVNIFGFPVGQAPHGLILAAVAAMFVFLCWQYSVLKDHQVRGLFKIGPSGR